MMSGIKCKNTRPEMLVRKALHRRGFRYRLHDKSLPGKPDLVFAKYNAVIQINGCFWHKHSCYLFKWPSTHKEFWKNKIEGNVKRDKYNLDLLEEDGWRSLTIWECVLKGKTKRPFEQLIDDIEDWLLHGQSSIVIPDA